MVWKTGSELNTMIFVFQPLNQLVKPNLSTLMSCGIIFLNMKLSSYWYFLHEVGIFYHMLSDLIYQFIFAFLGHTRVAQGSTTGGQNCF